MVSFKTCKKKRSLILSKIKKKRKEKKEKKRKTFEMNLKQNLSLLIVSILPSNSLQQNQSFQLYKLVIIEKQFLFFFFISFKKKKIFSFFFFFFF